MQTVALAVIARVEHFTLIDDPPVLGADENARDAGRAAAVRIDRSVLVQFRSLEALVTGKVADRRLVAVALTHGRAVRGVRIGDVGHGSSGHDWHR